MSSGKHSPEVKKWIHRRNTLNWLLKYHEVKQSGRKSKLKKHKLRKVCIANELPAPSIISRESNSNKVPPRPVCL